MATTLLSSLSFFVLVDSIGLLVSQDYKDLWDFHMLYLSMYFSLQLAISGIYFSVSPIGETQYEQKLTNIYIFSMKIWVLDMLVF